VIVRKKPPIGLYPKDEIAFRGTTLVYTVLANRVL